MNASPSGFSDQYHKINTCEIRKLIFFISIVKQTGEDEYYKGIPVLQRLYVNFIDLHIKQRKIELFT
jgi:hypothetical protein